MVPYHEQVTDLIRRRRSWRSYLERPLSPGQIGQINRFIESMDPPPFGTNLRFGLVDAHLPEKKRMPGTYGIIKGARHILVGAMTSSPMDFEDFGYSFESIILFCTELGLGTCWMGGTFNRTLFGLLIGLKDGETIPAVSPVGEPASSRSLLDSLFVLSAGSKSRKPFPELFFSRDFSTPMSEPQAGEYAQALEMVRLAPSAANKQPWRIVAAGDSFHFFLARSTAYRKIFPEADLQRIDMGIAMFHFESAARASGLAGSWQRMDASHGICLPRNVEYRISWVAA
ncbi:MAG TPA: nitroreductase family protein [Deltaproteobacteria bacterium]|jgi:nitroreductase|nr:nitroreductase family protein [Deltaproteobacteria bacterium]HQH99771.1 nitroreductase family protein [Deltaproteobacteria bacterium]HQJ08672.1 nitroreductase family protein [Deltaproteobacteria bacterium]